MPTTERRERSASTYVGSSSVRPKELRNDPYVELLRRHMQDPDLFRGDPRQTRRRQQELVVPYLSFFLRHDNDGFYRELFARAGLLNRHKTAVRDRVSLDDLYALRVFSDDLHGDGQLSRLTGFAAQGRERAETERAEPAHRHDIRHASDDNDGAGKIFTSTGTSDHPSGPVRVYRSALTLELAGRMNAQLIDWAMGTKLVEGSALLYMAERMTEQSWFAHLGREVLVGRDVPVRFGAHLKGLSLLPGSDSRALDPAQTVRYRLRPDVGAIRDFAADEHQPKYLVGDTASLHDLLVNTGMGRRALLNVMAGIPPLHLGRSGVMVVGGGTKDGAGEVPGRSSQDLIREIAQYVTTETGKGRVPAPVIDVLGLTESVSTFVGRTASPLSSSAWVHYPHPLTYVSFLEGAGVPRPVSVSRRDVGDRERQLFFVNFTCLDYLEAVVSGDVVAPVYRDHVPQHGFIFRHRR